jgi:hypothetical protein
MAYIPDDTVLGSVVDIMQGNGDLCHTEARSQMAGIHSHLLNDILTQLLAELRQGVYRQFAQILRILDLIE